MAAEVNLPKPKSTRDRVIGLLSEEWPLSAKQIHAKLKGENGGISYQAVHRAIHEMDGEGVLEKKEGGCETGGRREND